MTKALVAVMETAVAAEVAQVGLIAWVVMALVLSVTEAVETMAKVAMV